jgi:hypothetical protein
MFRRHRRTPIRAIVRVRERYKRVHQRYPRLFGPQRFSEKMQWRKLFDPDPLFEILCDKLACRDFIVQRLGPDCLPPLLWSGDDAAALPLELLSVPYVVKCAHGSGMNLFVDDPKTVDAEVVRRRVREWQAQNFGERALEPGYVPVKPRILVEALLAGADGALPTEYKFFLFDGRIALFMVRVNDDHDRHRNFFTRADWTQVHVSFDAPPVRPFGRPPELEAMCEIAELLGRGLDHIRVDLLVSAGRIYVGELTPYSFSGMARCEPDAFDLELGQEWRITSPFWRALRAMLGLASRGPRAIAGHAGSSGFRPVEEPAE